MAPVTDRLHIDIARKTWPAVGGRPSFDVLREIRIDVDPGSFVVITGPSGCGKSTLLNIVAGLDTEFDGRVDLGDAAKSFAFVFQTPRLLPWRTVRQNIDLVLPDGDPRRARVAGLLARVGLAGAEDAYPERISLGMQRRAALARAFILEPQLLVMDEPFVSLDEDTAHALRTLLIELWTSRPTTVLFVTHDRTEAVMLGTRILRLGGGSATLADDTPVRLTVAERASRDAVAAERKRIFSEP